MIQAVLHGPQHICQVHIFPVGADIGGRTKGVLSDEQLAAYRRAIDEIRHSGFRVPDRAIETLKSVGFKVLIV